MFVNNGYYEFEQCKRLLRNLKGNNIGANNVENLDIRLKNLSHKEREFINIVHKVVLNGKSLSTSWFPTEAQPNSSSDEIMGRMTAITDKVGKAPIERARSNFLVRIFKGIGNLFFRHSSKSLYQKIISLTEDQLKEVIKPKVV